MAFFDNHVVVSSELPLQTSPFGLVELGDTSGMERLLDLSRVHRGARVPEYLGYCGVWIGLEQSGQPTWASSGLGHARNLVSRPVDR